jgi:hypothetical protein
MSMGQMVIQQKNCVFDCECPFLKKQSNEVSCGHPAYTTPRFCNFISVLFEKCPLKITELVFRLEKEI